MTYLPLNNYFYLIIKKAYVLKHVHVTSSHQLSEDSERSEKSNKRILKKYLMCCMSA